MKELEIVLNNQHISFMTNKIGSLSETLKSQDPKGLKIFYYVIQDLKSFVLSMIALHFKVRRITHLSKD
jgi:protein mago nashi